MTHNVINIQDNQDEVFVFSKKTGASFAITRNAEGVLRIQLQDLEVFVGCSPDGEMAIGTPNEYYRDDPPNVENEPETVRVDSVPPVISTLPPPPSPSEDSVDSDPIEFMPELVQDSEVGQDQEGPESEDPDSGWGFGGFAPRPPAMMESEEAEESVPSTQPVPSDPDDEDGVTINVEPDDNSDNEGGSVELEDEEIDSGQEAFNTWLRGYHTNEENILTTQKEVV